MKAVSNDTIPSSEETKQRILQVLETVMDPEVPVLSVLDLGVVRKVEVVPGEEPGKSKVIISVTPTYTGCPAIDVMRMSIRMALLQNGFANIEINEVLSPAWTTEWMSEEGKRKLREYGIAPPNPKQQVCDQKLFAAAEAVQCPQCNSYHTHRISEFGSTACKALYQCDDCKEPFDYFKCH